MEAGGASTSTIAKDPASYTQLTTEALGDFDLLAEGIFSILWKDLGFVSPCIAMFDQRSNALRIMKHAANPNIEVVLKSMVGKNVDDFKFFLEDEDNLLVRSYKEKQIFIRDSVKDLAVPYVKNRVVVKAVDSLIDLKMVAVVPITVREKCLGVLCFGSRQQSKLTKTEEFFLTRMSEQIGVYLQQSWLIKLLDHERQILKKQNHDLTQMLQVKRAFLGSLRFLIKDLPELNLKGDSSQKIKDHLKYLDALLLISEPYTSENVSQILYPQSDDQKHIK